MRKVLLLVSVLFVLASFAFMFPLPVSAHETKPTVANAGGGGCNGHWGGPNNSFEMGVCISDRGTNGQTIYPDVYVNQQAPGWNWSCSLYLELWAGNYRYQQSGPYSCTAGHYQTSFSWFSSVGWLHSSVWISFNGTFYRIGDSPTYYYCDHC